jgi:hypothetical protein
VAKARNSLVTIQKEALEALYQVLPMFTKQLACIKNFGKS